MAENAQQFRDVRDKIKERNAIIAKMYEYDLKKRLQILEEYKFPVSDEDEEIVSTPISIESKKANVNMEELYKSLQEATQILYMLNKRKQCPIAKIIDEI